MHARSAPARRGMLRTFAIMTLLAATLVQPSAARAEGTGDLSNPPPDRLTPTEASRRRSLESLYPKEASGAKTAAVGAASVSAAYMEPDLYRFIWTTTHPQERSFWCGPATVQVLDDYFGTHVSQATLATWLGTTSAGTAFTLVDDALRHFTGKAYYYYGGLTESNLWVRIQHSLLDHAQPLAIDVRILASVWPNYNFDHAGHITVLEGFDWRHSIVRLNDVYSEKYWRTGGGDTLGHKNYARSVIWDGIYRHPQRAVVAAP